MIANSSKSVNHQLTSLRLLFFLAAICFAPSGIAQPPQIDEGRAKQAAKNMDIVLLIDNSGSMDLPGHDAQGLRREAIRIAIDKAAVGDGIAIVDFSDTSVLLQALTRITPGNAEKKRLKQIANVVKSGRQLTDIKAALETAFKELNSSRAIAKNSPAVILLTDGEVDVLKGPSEKKKRASEANKKELLAQTLPRFVSSGIPIYSVALTNKADQRLLQKLAASTNLEQTQNEQHYFSLKNNADLVFIFSKIINQLKHKRGIEKTIKLSKTPYQKTIQVDALKKHLAYELTYDQAADVKVSLKSPQGNEVKPQVKAKSYRLYSIDKPEPGQWQVEIKGKEDHHVNSTMIFDQDLEIDLPFPIRSKTNQPFKIFAKVINKGKPVTGSRVAIDVDNHPEQFSLGPLTVSITKPDTSKAGPFPLKRQNNGYHYFFEDTGLPGEYTLDFKLAGRINGRNALVQAQKTIMLMASAKRPHLALLEVKDHYTPGETINLDITVKGNVGALQAPSIPVEVRSAQSSEVIAVPQTASGKYSLAYNPGKMQGELTFSIKEDPQHYQLGAYKRKTKITQPVDAPQKSGLGAGAYILGATLIAALCIIGYIIVSQRKHRRLSQLRPAPEPTKKETPQKKDEDEIETEKQEAIKLPEENAPVAEAGSSQVPLTPQEDMSGFKQIEITSKNLKNADLEMADLRGADLIGANLEGAKMTGACLEGSKLGGANLKRASLGGANLQGADLFDSGLGGADLSEANLYNANLKGANLFCTNLEGALLKGANLELANMKNTKLKDSIGLTREQLETAKAAEGAELPGYLEESAQQPSRLKIDPSLAAAKRRPYRIIDDSKE